MMKKIPVLIFALLAFLPPLCAQEEVPSGQRFALLIGNSNYDGVKIQGVGKSLDEVEKALEGQGFAIVRHENLAKEDEQKKVVEEFAQSVPTAGVALIYYIGLGANIERLGKRYNLLRPTGEEINNEGAYRSVGLNVSEDLLKAMNESSGARLTLIFLDACWESPIVPDADNVLGGVRPFEFEQNATVMIAAQEPVALPEADSASPMAKSLVKNLPAFAGSIREGCEAVSRDLQGAWSGGVVDAGIGAPPAFDLVEGVDKARSAGDAFVNSVGMVFHWCPPGSFTMGSDKSADASTRDRAPVKVTLTKGFWMGECEVTQREYNLVMRKNPPIGFTQHPNAPFWGANEAKSVDEFCKKMTEMDKKAGLLPNGWEYVCPSEAEWEYACRAGSTSDFCFGDSIADLGKYGNFADKTLFDINPDFYWAETKADDGHAEELALVGSFAPNAWGLRDMHGNVAELVADHYQIELPGGTDPLVRLEKNGQPIIRGGAWCSLPTYCESSFRNTLSSRNKANFIGFRILLKKLK